MIGGYSQPARENQPLWLTHLATYALGLSDDGLVLLRGTVPEEWRDLFDLSVEIQKNRKVTTEEEARDHRLTVLTKQELEKRESRRNADAFEMRNHRKPIRCSLTDELALPDEDEIYAIDQLLPIGGNALFAGRYKAGKTTFNANLLRAWADGEPFLGHFRCHPQADRPVVTIFNYEMTRSQFRRWMRRFGIRNHHLINAVHLRGVSMPIALPEVRHEIAGWLKDSGTGMWLVDPASRAMAGMGDGLDNSDVSTFTMWLDEIKEEAGVRDLIMNIHMPHTNQEKETERAIGAQAWSAWADALWMLTMDKDDNRWFHAFGRDVDTDKQLVNYNKETMDVQLINTDPVAMRHDRIQQAVIKTIEANGEINKRGLRGQVPALCGGCKLVDVDSAVDRLIALGVVAVRPGPNRQLVHILTADHPGLGDDDDE